MLKATFCVYDKPHNVGGPVTWVQQLLPALRTLGIESRCLISLHHGDTGPALAALTRQGFDCVAVARPDNIEDETRWILDCLRDDPPDVFVPNLVLAGYFAARSVRAAGIPTVGIIHSDDDFYRALTDEFVFGPPAFQLSALVCVSRALDEQVSQRRPQRTLVRRIPYGVAVPDTRVMRTPQANLRLVFVGRLAEEQKRISDLTTALCRAVREIEGVEAVMYGDGPDRAAVEAILKRDGAGMPVRLGGLVDSNVIQQRLLECDVFVLLSDYEGLPIALMEAMACGCVPVCMRGRSGIPELITDGETGVLVEDRGDSFVGAIRLLKDNFVLWERLSAAARLRVSEGYSSDASAANWAALLEEMAHSNAQPARPIRVPRRLGLPAPNRHLEGPHQRDRRPGLPVRVFRRGRMLAGRLRRTLLRQPVP